MAIVYDDILEAVMFRQMDTASKRDDIEGFNSPIGCVKKVVMFHYNFKKGVSTFVFYFF